MPIEVRYLSKEAALSAPLSGDLCASRDCAQDIGQSSEKEGVAKIISNKCAKSSRASNELPVTQ